MCFYVLRGPEGGALGLKVQNLHIRTRGWLLLPLSVKQHERKATCGLSKPRVWRPGRVEIAPPTTSASSLTRDLGSGVCGGVQRCIISAMRRVACVSRLLTPSSNHLGKPKDTLGFRVLPDSKLQT